MNRHLLTLAAASLVAFSLGCGASTELRADRANCRAGNDAACVDLGDRYVLGNEVEVDLPRAEEIYLRSCRNDPAGPGCEAYVDLATSRADSIDAQRGVELLWRNCRRYDIAGCSDLLSLYENPDLSVYDPERALAVRERLCDDGWDLFCGGLDSDADGISDGDDACPLTPEDLDNFEDTDGCPEPDNDDDGLVDALDECPNEAEDFDGFEDNNGCPDPDNDGDGVLDADDACPDVAEDFDGFEDTDGCPEADNDFDGILDANDACPLEPEDFDGFEDADGCPEEGTGLVTLTCDAIVISDTVYFDTGLATIQSRSFELLDQVAGVLNSVSYITLVEIAGHTDDRGSDELNLTLSDDRAASVRSYLVEAGIAPERLRSVGYGETMPIADNATSAGRAENRRVAFDIIEQDSRCAD